MTLRSLRRLPPLCCAALVATAAAAAPIKTTMIAAKVGRSNVQIRIVIHPQADACTKALAETIKTRAREIGVSHVRDNLKTLVKKAGTDASGPTQFFGVAVLAGCPKDGSGSAWIAFPAEGEDRMVTRYEPKLGWSPFMKL